MHDILVRITQGEGEEEDLARLQELSESIMAASLCGLGQTAPNPVLSSIRHFRQEYIDHIKHKKCAAGVCRGLARVSGRSSVAAGRKKKSQHD